MHSVFSQACLVSAAYTAFMMPKYIVSLIIFCTRFLDSSYRRWSLRWWSCHSFKCHLLGLAFDFGLCHPHDAIKIVSVVIKIELLHLIWSCLSYSLSLIYWTHLLFSIPLMHHFLNLMWKWCHRLHTYLLLIQRVFFILSFLKSILFEVFLHVSAWVLSGVPYKGRLRWARPFNLST